MSMKLQYNLENIGNIDKASITIKPLTIIAGENSSGKTFVTKSLYTILSHLKKDILLKKYLDLYTILYSEIKQYISDNENNLNIKNEKMEQSFYQFFEEFISTIQFSKNDVSFELKSIFLSLFDNKIPINIEIILDDCINLVKDKDNAIIEILILKLEEAFKKNFQITNLESLTKDLNNQDIKLSIDKVCNISINSNINISLETNQNIFEKFNNVVFFDSPVYIKIRKALQKDSTRYSNMMNINLEHIKAQDKYLKGYPEYIDDLYHDLDLEYIDTADFDEISQEIQKIISGKLDVSRSGDINYTDNKNNTIPLSLTAMGISNIGLIDLLLRNNVINKGSFLIMDEPEVHLHPEWQVVLAKILYKIAKGGANIIIATHSLDFLKAFENILKKENEIAEDIIAINKMPYDESFSALSELEKVGIVLDDLSKPFYDLYMQDI